MVAKVNEQQAAVVAYAMDPAGQANGLADIGFAKSGTSVAAVTMHHIILEASAARPRKSALRQRRNRAEKRMTGPICQG
jgi:hypothetical protein